MLRVSWLRRSMPSAFHASRFMPAAFHAFGVCASRFMPAAFHTSCFMPAAFHASRFMPVAFHAFGVCALRSMPAAFHASRSMPSAFHALRFMLRIQCLRRFMLCVSCFAFKWLRRSIVHLISTLNLPISPGFIIPFSVIKAVMY